MRWPIFSMPFHFLNISTFEFQISMHFGSKMLRLLLYTEVEMGNVFLKIDYEMLHKQYYDQSMLDAPF